MAVDFSAKSYYQCGTSPVSGFPVSMACWVKPGTMALGNDAPIISIGNLGIAQYTGVYMEFARSLTSVRAVSSNNNSFSGAPVATVTYTTGTWCHAAAVFDTDDKVYFNGGNSGTDTSVARPSFTSAGVRLAQKMTSSTDSSCSMAICEVGIWNVALTPQDVFMLSQGIPPSKVRPEGLVRYLPLHDALTTAIEYRNSAVFTKSSSGTIALTTPPKLIYTRRPSYSWLSPVSSPTNIDVPSATSTISLSVPTVNAVDNITVPSATRTIALSTPVVFETTLLTVPSAANVITAFDAIVTGNDQVDIPSASNAVTTFAVTITGADSVDVPTTVVNFTTNSVTITGIGVVDYTPQGHIPFAGGMLYDDVINIFYRKWRVKRRNRDEDS
jgi:hypothetical protein